MKLNKKYALITATDKKYSQFLINNWLKSLLANADLSETDIIIMDYGIPKKQKEYLNKKGIKLIPCKKRGHIVNIRYNDIYKFLKNNRYQQIINCDGGDIIFQGNVTELCKKNPNDFRAVCEEHSGAATSMVEYALLKKCFTQKTTKEILSFLKNKKPVNGGLIVAPYKKFLYLCEMMDKLILNKEIYGPDQIILNYILYKKGFIKLNRTYNYTLFDSKIKFKIKEGLFYDEYNNKIIVVHNSGKASIFRLIKNFGYGKDNNKIKKVSFIVFNLYHKLIKLEKVFKTIRKISQYIKN